MTGLSYRVNSTRMAGGVRRAMDRLSGEAREAAIRTAIDIENRAKELAPVDTGRLRASINHTVSGGRVRFSVQIGTNVDYAADVEYGTAPHIIRPKTKRALYWPGAAHPVARVNHPGTSPRPFMRPAIYAAQAFWAARGREVG